MEQVGGTAGTTGILLDCSMVPKAVDATNQASSGISLPESASK